MDMDFIPVLYKEPDFESFWQKTRKQSDAQPLSPAFEPYPFHDGIADIQRIYYSGFDGGRIEGLLLRPVSPKKAAPALLFTHGYGKCVEAVTYYLKWVLAGFTVLALNMRVEIPMRNEDTPTHRVPKGIMVRGTESPETYMYRYVYTDMYRAIQLLRTIDGVDPDRIGIWGASQGAAVAIAAAALDGNIAFLSLLYPFMTNIKNAVERGSDGPYQEFWRYFRLYDPQLKTMPALVQMLSYFDTMHFAEKLRCPVLLGAGLKDTCCIPQNTVGFYNLLSCPKQLELYHTHGHEDIPAFEDLSYLFCVEKAFK
ncbi:MAG: acetylxylan esterase [Ruminococcaceae bacterium]|nr:acetylxylan esterase [Oscillospiraceae bacterium]